MQPFIAVTGSEQRVGRWKYLSASLPYLRAVEMAGGVPFVVGLTEENLTEIARRADGLLLTGGGDAEPSLFGQARHHETSDVQWARDQNEIGLIRAFQRAGKPMLGICRGIQMLAVALGGSLHQHIFDIPAVEVAHGDYSTRHAVRFTEGSRLRAVYRRDVAIVNSTHHQAVDAPPEGFVVTARSQDGVIEGMERGSILGVQWHPERILEEGHLPLFEDFIALCAGGASWPEST